MNLPKFVVGQVVRLNSDTERRMTVSQIYTNESKKLNRYLCIWFDDDFNVREYWFAEDTLQ